MPDDVNTSAEQDEFEDEMSQEELDDLWEQDESEYENEDQDTSTKSDDQDDDQDADDDKGDDESDDDDSDESEDDDLNDDDSDEDGDDEDDDSDPLSDIKKQAAALKEKEQAAEKQAAAEAERKQKMDAAKENILKDMFGAEKVKIGDKEVDLKAIKEDYGEDLDTLITARAYQIAEPLVAKALESAGFASQDELSKIQAENAEFRFMSQVAQTHPEIWKLKDSDEFWNWVDSQGDDVATLMEKGGVDGVSTVIGAYKKATIQKTNQKIDRASAEKKQKHDKIHKSTLRSKAGKKRGGKKNDGPMSEAEMAATFDSAEITD